MPDQEEIEKLAVRLFTHTPSTDGVIWGKLSNLDREAFRSLAKDLLEEFEADFQDRYKGRQD